MTQRSLCRHPIRGCLHELQQRHPNQKHRINSRPTIVLTVKNIQLRSKGEKLGQNLLPKQPVAVGRAKKFCTKIIGMIKASLGVDEFDAHGPRLKADWLLVNVYLIN